jgi:hypothetical protein
MEVVRGLVLPEGLTLVLEVEGGGEDLWSGPALHSQLHSQVLLCSPHTQAEPLGTDKVEISIFKGIVSRDE